MTYWTRSRPSRAATAKAKLKRVCLGKVASCAHDPEGSELRGLDHGAQMANASMGPPFRTMRTAQPIMCRRGIRARKTLSRGVHGERVPPKAAGEGLDFGETATPARDIPTVICPG